MMYIYYLVAQELLDYLYPQSCPPTTIQPSHLLLFIWVTKALLMRNHKLSLKFLAQVGIFNYS